MCRDELDGGCGPRPAVGRMNADKIDAEMEKVREAMDTAQEISDALAQPLTNGQPPPRCRRGAGNVSDTHRVAGFQG